MRDRLQLSLFPGREVNPPVGQLVVGLPAIVEPISRTRLLQDAIRRELPGARVVIVDTRSMLLSQSERNGVRTIRVHQMFLDADDHTRIAIAQFLRGDSKAGVTIDRFIAERQHLLRFAAKPLVANAHVGRSITFGSYDHRAQRITIHPVLDRPQVPSLIVARIVHHEMLHGRHGEQRNHHNRRVVHGPAFRADEALFDGAVVADAWLEQHLDELLRWRPGQP
jgi:hypothetical protein